MKNIKILSINPVVIYFKLTSEIKIIFKGNNGKSGIYRWNNFITTASYVESAVNLSRRFSDYLSTNFLKKRNTNNTIVLYRALLKYGYFNIYLDILEYCDKISIINREQYYIDLLNPEYNICFKTGSSLGRITMKETRLKLRNIWLNRLYSRSKDNTVIKFILNSI